MSNIRLIMRVNSKMIELPEAIVLAKQINETLVGKIIKKGIRNSTPHTFVFPQDRDLIKQKGHKTDYPPQLGEEYKDKLFSETIKGLKILKSWAEGMVIFIQLGEFTLSLGCGGENIIYHENENTLPKKDQLYIEFDDGTFLTVTISGWGEVRLFKSNEIEKHPHVGYNKINPLSNKFTFQVFEEMINQIPENRKCSVKYFFVTDPGLRGIGNGVIQDIFFLSKIHPKREMKSLTKDEKRLLYETTRRELHEMVNKRGRSTEKDLFDINGGYQNKMYAKTKGTPCPNCSTLIEKTSYLGGSVYFCPKCQLE